SCSGQADLGSSPRVAKEETEARPLDAAADRRPLVARQAAIHRAVAHAGYGREQPQADHCTGTTVGRGEAVENARVSAALSSERAFLTGLPHLYNLVPYQRRAQHARQCGVEVEGGRVPTVDWMLNLQILTSGGFR